MSWRFLNRFENKCYFSPLGCGTGRVFGQAGLKGLPFGFGAGSAGFGTVSGFVGVGTVVDMTSSFLFIRNTKRCYRKSTFLFTSEK